MIIDVSHNNGVINWSKVKPHIEKAIIRVGYGNDATNQDDKQFHQNVAECNRLGIPYDFYIYSYARNLEEAKSEARHALRLAEANRDAVIYFDSEEPGTQSIARACAEAFKNNIKAAGRKVGLYCSESWYKSYLNGIDGFDKLWIAKYGTNDGHMNQQPSIDCDLWQYSSRGVVDGISGFVDVNEKLKPDEKPFVPPEIVKDAVYRLYNTNTGEHLFTKSVKERDGVLRAGWTYEGVGWIAPSVGNVPVFRLYNGVIHHYTTSTKEMDDLTKSGWTNEGRVFYSADKKKGVPVHRLYNPNDLYGTHMFTISTTEKDNLVKAGWHYEKYDFYGERV